MLAVYYSDPYLICLRAESLCTQLKKHTFEPNTHSSKGVFPVGVAGCLVWGIKSSKSGHIRNVLSNKPLFRIFDQAQPTHPPGR